LTSVAYSRGRGLRDVRPAQCMATGFPGLVDALVADIGRSTVKSSSPYVCGPLNGARAAAGALPVRFVALDADAIAPDSWGAWRAWWGGFSVAMWPTHSSKREALRERVLIELAAPAERGVAIATADALAEAICRDLNGGVTLDRAVHRPEQPLLLPPRGVPVSRFDGDPAPLAGASTPEEGRPLQKRAEDDLSRLLLSSVGAFPSSTLPTGPGERNACLFRLARWLRGTQRVMTDDELRAVALAWHARAVGLIDTKDSIVTVADLIRGYHAVRAPHGAVMAQIAREAAGEVVPHVERLATLGYGDSAMRLVRLCAALQRHHGDAPIFLAARTAGEFAQMHYVDAAKVLSQLVRDGVLELVQRGAGRVASRYRFVWRLDEDVPR